MEIILGKEFSITPAMNEFINTKLERLYKVVGPDNLVRVILGKDGSHDFTVNLQVGLFHRDIVAKASGDDFHETFLLAKRRLLAQIQTQIGKSSEKRPQI